jgi:hypothetical protein
VTTLHLWPGLQSNYRQASPHMHCPTHRCEWVEPCQAVSPPCLSLTPIPVSEPRWAVLGSFPSPAVDPWGAHQCEYARPGAKRSIVPYSLWPSFYICNTPKSPCQSHPTQPNAKIGGLVLPVEVGVGGWGYQLPPSHPHPTIGVMARCLSLSINCKIGVVEQSLLLSISSEASNRAASS